MSLDKILMMSLFTKSVIEVTYTVVPCHIQLFISALDENLENLLILMIIWQSVILLMSAV
jgi:hypothetical protein